MARCLNASYLLYVETEWLRSRGQPEAFEYMAADELADQLRKFYGEARTKKRKDYSKQSLISLRAGIQRHIQEPPYNRQINIITDREFKQANMVKTGRIKKNRADGNDTTQHKSAIQPGDVRKMYNSGTLSNLNPKALQNKVFFEIMLHFGRRAKEGLRDLKTDSFEFRTDDNGHVYATIPYNEKSKTNHGTESDREEKEQRMYETGDPETCPIVSLRLYLSKLNPKSPYFFQHVSTKKSVVVEQYWYNGKCLGINSISCLMKDISKEAKLSQIYTNHCIRATSVTVLSNEGHDANDIIAISGHKNPSSLIPYTRKVGDSKRRKMSSSLTSFIKGEAKPKSAPCATVSTPQQSNSLQENQIPAPAPCATVSIPPQSNNLLDNPSPPSAEPGPLSLNISENVSQTQSDISFHASMQSVAKLVGNNVINAQSISFNFNFQGK